MVEEVATDDPAGLASPAGGASSSAIAADGGGTVEPEVILGHPMLLAPRDVSLDEAMGTTRWRLPKLRMCFTERVGASLMNDGACCSGLP
jgi:hypothetical protein